MVAERRIGNLYSHLDAIIGHHEYVGPDIPDRNLLLNRSLRPQQPCAAWFGGQTHETVDGGRHGHHQHASRHDQLLGIPVQQGFMVGVARLPVGYMSEVVASNGTSPGKQRLLALHASAFAGQPTGHLADVDQMIKLIESEN